MAVGSGEEKSVQPDGAGSLAQPGQNHGVIEVDQVTEKKVLRKLDRVVVPIVFLAC